LRKIAIRFTVFLLSFLATSAAIYAFQLYQSLSRLGEGQGGSPFSGISILDNNPENQIPKWEGRERVNILLLGGDSRGKEHEIPRSDTMLVASIDPVTKRAHLMSILRDTYVDIPGRGRDRINAAVSYGGPRLAMRTVSQLLGIPIQYYVYTDFEGFVAVVDAVGGIDIEVEKDMKYYDRADGPEYAIDLKKGWQHLDGRKALQYVRFRHDALSDYARTERQRKFLIALARKMQSTTSLLKLPSIIDKVEPYVETNMTVSDMVKLGALALEAKNADIVGVQIPPNELLEPREIGGASVLVTDPRRVREYVKDLFESAVQPSSSPSPSRSPGRSPAGRSPSPSPARR